MHIAIDASRAAREQKTGVEHYAAQLIGQLVRYVALAANNPIFNAKTQAHAAETKLTLYCQDKPNEWLQELDSYDFVTVKQLRWPLKRLWTQGRMSLEMVYERPDVLFIPASALPAILAPTTVTTVHDVGFMAFPDAYAPKERSFLEWSTRRALQRARAVITISEFSKQEIARYFGEKASNNVTVIPLGVAMERFTVPRKKAQASVRTAYGVATPFILYVGRLEQKKNIAGVVKAFHTFQKQYQTGHQLVLVGNPGYGWEAAAWYIQRHGLENDIIRPGYVSDNDLPYWYAAADALLFPSYYEGFGLPVLEAMAAGTPVVASTAGSLPEVTGKAALSAAPNDTATLAQLLHTAVTDAQTRNTLIAAGRKRASEYSWEQCAARTFAVLTQAAR